MTSNAGRFKNLMSAIEDMHGVAAEGVANDLTPDMDRALLISLQSSMIALRQHLTSISLTLMHQDGGR